MMNKTRKKIKRISIMAVFVLLAALVLVLLLENRVEKNGHYTPSYEKLAIEKIVGDGIDDEDYKTIFFQTGLGKDAVDSILENNENFIGELEGYQKNFFEENEYDCHRITLITGEEQSIDQQGNVTSKFEIQGLKDGDILISLSTHSLGWRHGHAAIVVDGNQGSTLESLVLGMDSDYQNYKKWTFYPTFIQLRIKEEALNTLKIDREKSREKLTQTAKEKLVGIPYDLFAGIPSKYVEDVQKTHCAHLVWYAYREMGIDIDSDKGIFVTPYDIAHSNLLEIVQIYGVDPNEYFMNSQ